MRISQPATTQKITGSIQKAQRLWTNRSAKKHSPSRNAKAMEKFSLVLPTSRAPNDSRMTLPIRGAAA